LETSVSNLETDVSDLKTGVSDMKTDVFDSVFRKSVLDLRNDKEPKSKLLGMLFTMLVVLGLVQLTEYNSIIGLQ
jgi:hypothetical protein